MKMKLKHLLTITTVALLTLTPIYGAAHDDEGVPQQFKRFSSFAIAYHNKLTYDTVPSFQGKLVQNLTFAFGNPTSGIAEQEGAQHIDLRDCSILLDVRHDHAYGTHFSLAPTGYDKNYKDTKSAWDRVQDTIFGKDSSLSSMTYISPSCSWKEIRTKDNISITLVTVAHFDNFDTCFKERVLNVHAALFNMKTKQYLGRCVKNVVLNKALNFFTEIPVEGETAEAEVTLLRNVLQERVRVLKLDGSIYPEIH
jgi:hypothetical protein